VVRFTSPTGQRHDVRVLNPDYGASAWACGRELRAQGQRAALAPACVPAWNSLRCGNGLGCAFRPDATAPTPPELEEHCCSASCRPSDRQLPMNIQRHPPLKITGKASRSATNARSSSRGTPSCRTSVKRTTNWRSRSRWPAAGRRVRRAGVDDLILDQFRRFSMPRTDQMQHCQRTSSSAASTGGSTTRPERWKQLLLGPAARWTRRSEGRAGVVQESMQSRHTYVAEGTS
jgi:hypothetical protein